MSLRDVSSADWDRTVSKADTLTVVDFWAPWCPWCRKLAPELEALAPQYTGKIAFVKLNVDEAPLIASRYGVMGLPTLKFFCGGRAVGELVGYMPRTMLKSEFDRALTTYKECLSQSSPLKS